MAYYLYALNIDACEAFTQSPRDVDALGVSYRSKAKAAAGDAAMDVRVMV
jgi:hypothetical protein